LDLLHDHTIDVVILDVLMPGIDGIQTLKKIRETSPLVQVIMLTGHATVDNAILGMKNGAYDFLMKPVDTKTLIAKINAAFDIRNEHQKRIISAKIENIVTRRGW